MTVFEVSKDFCVFSACGCVSRRELSVATLAHSMYLLTIDWAGEMAQWFRALVKNPSSIPSTHRAAHKHM